MRRSPEQKTKKGRRKEHAPARRLQDRGVFFGSSSLPRIGASPQGTVGPLGSVAVTPSEVTLACLVKTVTIESMRPAPRKTGADFGLVFRQDKQSSEGVSG